MDATSPVTPPQSRRFGPMKFSSALVVILAIAAGMAFVRAYFSLEHSAILWNHGYRGHWFEEVTQCVLAGVLLVFGLDLLVETVVSRNRHRPWGVGRVTIAVASLFLVFQWLAVIVSVEASSIRQQPLVCAWSIGFARDPQAWTNGLLQEFFPALAAVWITWCVSGRPVRHSFDLKEGVGWLIGVVSFGGFAARLFFP